MSAELFFVADLHFSHANIIKHCSRPFRSVEEHDEALVSNWNHAVGKHDTTYILGDFAYKRHNHWVNRLNGKKILILGNHDKMSQLELSQFAEVHKLLDTQIDKQLVTMCHYKMQSYRSSFHGAWHLFGHSHGRMPEGPLSFDVGVDVWDYSPIHWSEIVYKMTPKVAQWKETRNADGEISHEEYVKSVAKNNRQVRIENNKYLSGSAV